MLGFPAIVIGMGFCVEQGYFSSRVAEELPPGGSRCTSVVFGSIVFKASGPTAALRSWKNLARVGLMVGWSSGMVKGVGVPVPIHSCVFQIDRGKACYGNFHSQLGYQYAIVPSKDS